MVFLSVLLNAHDLSTLIRIVSLPGLRGPVGLVGHSARFTLMCSAGGPGFDPQIGHLFFGFTTFACRIICSGRCALSVESLPDGPDYPTRCIFHSRDSTTLFINSTLFSSFTNACPLAAFHTEVKMGQVESSVFSSLEKNSNCMCSFPSCSGTH